jgi:CheY-like chemotaxis protein
MNKKLILIVDDDERNIFALSAVMRHKGYETKSALNGEDCLNILRSDGDIDLVLMDIMMPIMDGYQATKLIREDQNLKQIPIIALTANAMAGDKEKCIEAGASDYQPKPINIEELLIKIENCLS